MNYDTQNLFETAPYIDDYNNYMDKRNDIEAELRNINKIIEDDSNVIKKPFKFINMDAYKALGYMYYFIHTVYWGYKAIRLTISISDQGDSFLEKIALFIYALIIGAIIILISILVAVLMWQTVGRMVFVLVYRFSVLKKRIAKCKENIEIQNSKKIECEAQLKELNSILAEQRAWLVKKSIVPDAYWQYVYELCAYINLKRADTLKEAINLLEDDLHKLKIENQLGQISSETNSIKSQLYKLNDTMEKAVYSIKNAYYRQALAIDNMNSSIKKLNSSVNSLWWK